MKQVLLLLKSKFNYYPGVSLFLLAILTAAFISFLIGFVGVMLSEIYGWSTEKFVMGLLGVKRKYEALRFLGIGMGGIVLVAQAVISYKRARAMEDTAKAQAKATELQAKANENTEQGQRQERLKNAIEHVGHDSSSIRLGGAYELFHLAQDTKGLRQTVLDILCAHIRQTTSDKKYQEDHKSKPSEEIQSLLTLLFVQEHDVFKGLHINLQESWLNGANLIRAKLEKANLSRAYLQWVNLYEANLQGADLEFAHLQNAHFTRARMQETCLLFAHLQGACIVAQMQGAVLHSARLQGAFLGKVHMQAANLDGANFRGATCLDRENLTQFPDHIRSLTGEQSGLSEVVFAGGLTQERVDSLVAGLPGNVATRLRAKLNPHVGRPASHVLP